MSSDEDFDSTPNVTGQYRGSVRPYMYEPLAHSGMDSVAAESDELQDSENTDSETPSIGDRREVMDPGSPEAADSSSPLLGMLEWSVLAN